VLLRHRQHHALLRLADPDLHGARPAYFSGASASSTSAPRPSAISPIAEEKPPAPQSVIDENRSASAARSTASITLRSVIGSPICTAPELSFSLSVCSSSELKVAPWMPSRPVRPPRATITSPLRAAFLARAVGRMPTLPT